MNSSDIPRQLTRSSFKKIQNSIEGIRQELPFLIYLTPEERRNHSEFSDKKMDFILKVLNLAEMNPLLVPPDVEVKKFRKGVALMLNLKAILRNLSNLKSAVDDATLPLKNEVLQTAFSFYDSALEAARVEFPGALTVAEDLKDMFPGKHEEVDKEEPEKFVKN